MQSMRRPMNWPVIVVLLAVVVVLVGRPSGANLMAPDSAAVLAVVDLERVVNNLDEWSKAKVDVENFAAQLEEEGNGKREELNSLREDLEAVYVPGTPDYDQALEEASLKALEYQAFVESSKRRIAKLRARRLHGVYKSIRDEVKTMAEEFGLDMVLVDDSKVAVPDARVGEAELMRQISARRMLYTNQELDVTDELIKRINGT